MSAPSTLPNRHLNRDDQFLVTTNGPDFSSHPDYFRARQQAAWEKFIATPAPLRTDENWRFADVKALQLEAFARATEVSDAEQAALLQQSKGLAGKSGQM